MTTFVRIIGCWIALASVPAEAASILLWHTQDKSQARFLETVLKEFGKARKVDVVTETGVDLTESLVLQSELGTMPDVVFAPGDIASLHPKVDFSEIPAELVKGVDPKALTTVELDGKRRGVPVIQGNHLLLYYNKKLVPKPAGSWEQLKTDVPALKAKGLKPLAVEYQNSYIFMAFFMSLGGEMFSQGKLALGGGPMARALVYYKELSEAGVVPKSCAYECVTRQFYAGEFAYALNGEWAIQDARKALGADLGIKTLPAMGPTMMVSPAGTFALFFPKKGLTGKKAKILKDLARYLLSPAVQQRWWKESERIPVLADLVRTLDKGVPPEIAESLNQHARSKPVLPNPKLAFAWTAVRKGLTEYLAGARNAQATAAYMVSLVP